MKTFLDRALHWAPVVPLAPLLLAQGWHVRKVTPRLPEPAGERYGVRAAEDSPSRVVRLLIVGDSAAAGVGVERQAAALSGQLLQALPGDWQIPWRLCAESGLATQGLIERLQDEEADAYDIAVVSTGVNDVIGGVPLARWQQQLPALVAQLQQRFQVRHVLLSPLPPMHRFSALPQPLRWVIGRRAHRFNQALAQYVVTHPACVPLPLDYPLSPGFLASDGFHPGAPAYRYWAGQLAQAIGSIAAAR